MSAGPHTELMMMTVGGSVCVCVCAADMCDVSGGLSLSHTSYLGLLDHTQTSWTTHTVAVCVCAADVCDVSGGLSLSHTSYLGLLDHTQTRWTTHTVAVCVCVCCRCV